MTTSTPIVLGEQTHDDSAITFGALEWDPQDDRRYRRNVSVPTLTPYLPAPGTGTGTAVIVVPGGGLQFLSVDNEGAWVARRLAEQGIAAFVLEYRTAETPVSPSGFTALMERAFTEPSYVKQIAIDLRAKVAADGADAVRVVREGAGGWGIDPDRIGMLGFSAGGYVTLAATFDAPAAAFRPSFLGLIYPAYWGEIVVPEPIPPVFLAWASDDPLADHIIDSSLRTYDAWRRAGGRVEAHAFSSGGHGFGMSSQGAPSDRWFDMFLAWLTASGF